MPGGVSTPALGYTAFVGIKFAGYSLAGRYLNQTYSKKVNPWFFGAVRTVVGMVVGGALFLVIAATKTEPLVLYGLLIPIRIVEWLVVITPFYDRGLTDKRRLLKCSTIGMVWSFILDIPAGLLGFLSAGVWVC